MENIENTVVQPSVDTPVIEQPATPVVAPSVPEPEFRINENGEIEIADSFFGIEEPVPQPIEQPVAPVEPEVKPYTLEEVSQVGLESLDPARIPAELVPFYRSMQADYTRKTQTLAQERRALEQKVAQPPQAPPVEVQPEVPQKNYDEQLYETAVKSIEQTLGTDFNELNPLHMTALTSEVADIQNRLATHRSHQEQLNTVVSRHTTDPRWGEIQSYADSVLESLPYAESKSIRDKLASGDVNYIDKFLQTAKEVFYETNGGTRVAQPKVPVNMNPIPFAQPKPAIQPPVLEGSGVGISASPQSGIDVRQLGKMSNDELANLFVQKGFANY